MEWNDRLLKYFKKLEKVKPLIICGDYNVAHHEIDLARPKENIGNAGFTNEERAWFDAYDESSRMMAMKPMADSVEVVNRLHQQGDYLIAITGRPEQIKEKTQLWLDREYSRKISELHFKSHGIRKAEMGLGLDIMAEDNGTEALAFAEARAKTYLLDYPWNRKVDSRENIVRVCSWEELGRIL